MAWLALVFFFGGPFWQTKAPADWTLDELKQLLTDSPWAQMVSAPDGSMAPAVQVYFATAPPIEQAERQWDSKKPRKTEPPEDYLTWLNENRANEIVVAVAVGGSAAFSDEREIREMEKDCVMRVGRKKYKIDGHFPPSPDDPYLRLAFPRAVKAADKTVSFDFYLPGVAIPFREAEFQVKDMIVDGKLEM
ncbi:MAG: hypothetical protein ACRD30_03870 [Bryobacteraceae bacterium]